jgi:hypothetical protein
MNVINDNDGSALDDDKEKVSDADKDVFLPVKLTLDHLLTDSEHNSYYFVDTNIIIAYSKNQIPLLNKYIDHMSLSGCHFFVTRRIASEFDGVIPSEFTIFQNDDADTRADSAYKEVMKQFDVHTDKFGVDMRWVLECGHCLHSCEEIPLEIFTGKGNSVFALTMNAKLVYRFLRSPHYREILERIIDKFGLEHLADLRLLHSDGTFEDLSAFPLQKSL